MSSFEIFPAPSVVPPSQTSPQVWPGISPSSTSKLVDVLKDNHRKWNIFFNDQGFHNHITHHALAIWSLGGPAAVIEAAYKHDIEVQRPLPEPSVSITEENWIEHLGDAKLFAAYTRFFKYVIERDGIDTTIEKYIFSREANFDPKYQDKQPEMLSRLCGGAGRTSGLLHPLIHVGYGYEFSIPGMVIEGLAQAAVHDTQSPRLVDASHWKSAAPALPESSAQGTHVFTIMARVLKDSQFDADLGDDLIGNHLLTIERHGTAISNYADEWSLDLTHPGELDRKIEELQWMNVILYATAGWSKDKPFHADFFLMHLVTSSLFLPSIASKLSSSSQALLLRTYLAFSLSWWAFRGRPRLDIKGFFAADTVAPKKFIPPDYPSLLPDLAAVPNPWTAMMEMAVVNPDEHLAKVQRALSHYNHLYGSRAAGLADFSETGLEGAEKLDGTLFIRAAGLTFQRVLAEKDPTKNFWDVERKSLV